MPKVKKLATSSKSIKKSSKFSRRKSVLLLPRNVSWHQQHVKFAAVIFICLVLGGLGRWWATSRASVIAPVTNRGAAYDRFGLFPRRTGFKDADNALTHLNTIKSVINRTTTIPYVVQFGDKSSSSLMAYQAGWVGRTFKPVKDQINIIYSIPLAYGSSANSMNGSGSNDMTNGVQVGKNLDYTASGAYDEDLRQAAQNLKVEGFGDATIRLGWEFDGLHSSWGARNTAKAPNNCSKFVAAYKRAHTALTSVAPDLQFDFNGMKNPDNQAGWACAYPGNSYVDIIGLDIYDRGRPCPANSTAVPNKSNWQDPTKCFNDFFKPALEFQKDFAVQRGKQVSFPEWGVQVEKEKGDTEPHISDFGGDNPAFIKGMADWMNSLPSNGPGSLAYSTYFWTRVWSLDRLDLASSLAEFKRQFGGSSTSTPPVNALPSVPVNLTASAGSASVNLNWSASTDSDGSVSGYETRHKISNNTNWEMSTALTGTSRTVSGLTNGTGYDFQVRSKDNQGAYSAWSGIISATPVVAPVSLSDVIVTDVSWSPASPVSGDGIVFSATIKNQGSAATPSGVQHGVGFQIDGTTVTWSDDSTTSLASGASRTLTANGGPNGSAVWAAPAGSYTVTALWDGPDRMSESNEANNTYQKTITITSTPVDQLGDIDGNGTVNGIDLSRVLTNYGAADATKSLGDANSDGIVNGLDLSIVLTNYGV